MSKQQQQQQQKTNSVQLHQSVL